jgi:GH24 family phage-related lysozyme (muramidase)
MVQYAAAALAREPKKPLPSLEEIQMHRKLAEAMMREGTSSEPVQHWTQGLSRVGDALMGAWRDKHARDQQAGLQTDANDALMGLYKPPSVTGGMPPIPASATQPAPQMSEGEQGVAKFAQPNLMQGRVAQALDPSLVQAVKGFEGYTPKASWDYKQHSVGYGTKAQSPGEQISQPEAEQRLNTELSQAASLVGAFAPNAPDGVKKALTSLTFNAGNKWMESGLGQAVKAGNWPEAQRIFMQYNKAGGETLPGLVNRRQQESQWFNQQPGQGQGMALGGPQQAQQPQMAGQQPQSIRTADASQGQGLDRETLSRMLANPLTRDAAQKLLLQQADPNAGLEAQYKRAQIEKLQREGQGGEEYGKTGTIVQDGKGNFYSVQFGQGGTKRIEKLQIGQDGLAPSRGTGEVDTGTGTQIIDRATGMPVRNVAKDLAGAEIQKQVGEATGKKIAAAPGDIAAADDALSILDSIENDPYLDVGTGASSVGNVIWGTGGHDFQTKVSQASSGAFLSAIQQMRGMGALSNAEGETATKAVARMKTSQSREGFLSALSDYRKVIRRGKSNAERMLKQGGQSAVSGGGLNQMSDEQLLEQLGR